MIRCTFNQIEIFVFQGYTEPHKEELCIIKFTSVHKLPTSPYKQIVNNNTMYIYTYIRMLGKDRICLCTSL